MKKIRSTDLFTNSLRFAGSWGWAVLLLFFFCAEASARVGGGQSYGGKGGGGDSGGAGGALIWLIFQLVRMLVYLTIEYPIVGIPLDILVLVAIVFYFSRRAKRMAGAVSNYSSAATGVAQQDVAGSASGPYNFTADASQLRKFDPNFSEIVFTDFCYALYARAQHARGLGSSELDLLSPYLSDFSRNALLQRNLPGLKEVKGIIVGAMSIVEVSGLDTPLVRIGVMFEANYTEVGQVDNQPPTEMTYYVRERWDLERKRDLLSPTPAQATALHCPRCGAPLERDTAGACAFCGIKIESGEFQWFVRGITLHEREGRGPLLTADVPEVGTDYPSVVQPGIENARSNFESNNPNFSWPPFQARARLIFDELQAAWSMLDWERARPHETDNIFQMHQYWIEAYKRQGLRNVLDQAGITAMQPVKFSEDAFYNSITLRIGAQGFDYTVDASGRVLSGSRDRLRYWSEYWTFIRNRQAKPVAARADLNCPNCGAPLQVNVSGICAFCGGKITSGEFDWVLSRIEQDESYTG
ncbi:MAG: TIM44-like domain-containing protein [bacterium]